MGKHWKQWETLFWGVPKSLQMVTAAMKLKDTCSVEEKLWLLRQHIQKQRHYFADKGLSSKSYGFSSSHVWMWELDHKEGWAPNNWFFWAVVLEKPLESPSDCKEIQPVHPKGLITKGLLRPEYSLEGLMLEAEAPTLWPPDVKSRLIWKDPDGGKDWGQEAKRAKEDEVVGLHHWFSGHELQQTLGDDEGQGSMVCCSPWGCKESDTNERLNNSKSTENCTSPYSLWTALMSKLKCSTGIAVHFHLFFFGWRIVPVHCLPMILAKVSNEQRKEVKRQDWKGKRGARSQSLGQTCTVGYCHHQSAGRKRKGTEFIKVRSSESACNAGDPGSIPGSGRLPEEGTGYPRHYSSASQVKNPSRMRETWVPSWFGKIPWRREPTSVFCPGEFHGL